jgi:predicted AAA+ superfamily ATPase
MEAMLARDRLIEKVEAGLARGPVVSLLGPRQCGKTTLATMLLKRRRGVHFDLEDPADLARLDNPMLALGEATDLVVIDEVQRKPDLFEVLRVLADRPGQKARFLLLGSASPALVRGVSESLAGRVTFVDMGGFDLGEVGASAWRGLWQRGGFPRSYLAGTGDDSFRWRQDFIRTFLERDLPQLGIGVASTTMRRFWTMVAHYHGQVARISELARSLSQGETSVRRYLDVLAGSLVVRQLQPWHTSLKKRQVKSPKVYVRDSGLLHALLSIENHVQLESHPKLGASWEGFVVEQLLTLRAPRDAYFWATHGGAELDLMIVEGGKPVGFEIKYTDAPRTTRSMRVAMEDLGLSALYVVHPGAKSYPLDENIHAVALADLTTLPEP